MIRVLILAVLVSGFASAQFVRGSLLGNVTDATGAAIAGADAKLTNPNPAGPFQGLHDGEQVGYPCRFNLRFMTSSCVIL